MPGLQAFHMGAFVVAARAGVPVVPVGVQGTRAILRAGQWFPRRGMSRHGWCTYATSGVQLGCSGGITRCRPDTDCAVLWRARRGAPECSGAPDGGENDGD